MELFNPADGSSRGLFSPLPLREADHRLARLHHAQQSDWSRLPLSQRLERLAAWGRALAADAGLPRLITTEMGKPITDARAEVAKSVAACNDIAPVAQRALAPESAPIAAAQARITREPLGVVLAIMPWNLPVWQVLRAALPALAAGNAVAVKHAPLTAGCSRAVAAAAHHAGVPLADFTVDLPDVDALLAHPRVAAVTLTGSTSAGRHVAAAAGRHIKKCVLELGGSDPFIVLPGSPDFRRRTAAVAAAARCNNAGQTCISAKRIIVVGDAAQFARDLAAAMHALPLGDPLLDATRIGPLARRDLLDALRRQVAQSLAMGAVALPFPDAPNNGGYFYPPRVLTAVTPAMPVWREETFGPVAPVIEAADIHTAIALANDSDYALGASVWAEDPAQALAVADQLRGGVIAVNTLVRSDVALPFGGGALSGFGRELGIDGIREFAATRVTLLP